MRARPGARNVNKLFTIELLTNREKYDIIRYKQKENKTMMIINAIENFLGMVSKNKDLILAGAVVAVIGGIILGLIVAPFFA